MTKLTDREMQSNLQQPSSRGASGAFSVRNCSKRGVLSSCLLCLIVIIVVDVFLVMPNFGYFNDQCILAPERQTALRRTVFAIVDVYDEMNQTYWLDYGTLLGAYRLGNVLPHDGDADVSRLIPQDWSTRDEEIFMDHFAERLYSKHQALLKWNTEVHYKDVRVDVARWVIDEDDHVYRYLARHLAYTQFRRNLPGDPLPKHWFVPTTTIKFDGRQVAAPRDVNAVLQYHYSMTVNTTVQYKWRCWVRALFTSS